MHSLFRGHRFKFCGLLSILSTASRTATVEVFFNVVPAEVTYLAGNKHLCKPIIGGAYLVAARTGFEVKVRQVHLFKTERTLQVLLRSNISTYNPTAATDTQLHRRSNTRPVRQREHLTWRATRW